MQAQPDFELGAGEPSAAFNVSDRHDPRIDPEPGDILRVGSEQREVVDVRDNRVEYGFPNRAATRWLDLFAWQRWARNAEVLRLAP